MMRFYKGASLGARTVTQALEKKKKKASDKFMARVLGQLNLSAYKVTASESNTTYTKIDVGLPIRLMVPMLLLIKQIGRYIKVGQGQ